MTHTPFHDDPNAPNVVPGPDPYDEPVVMTAKVDTYVRREDLGPDAYTFIAKGDLIPKDLEKLPRRK